MTDVVNYIVTMVVSRILVRIVVQIFVVIECFSGPGQSYTAELANLRGCHARKASEYHFSLYRPAL